MLITPAFAQAGGAGGSAFLVQLVPFIFIIAVFYFLIIRPQQQRLKKHREMVSSVQRNDKIVTSGGILGKVTKVIENEGGEAEIEIEIAENTRVRVVRSTIADVRRAANDSEPAKS